MSYSTSCIFFNCISTHWLEICYIFLFLGNSNLSRKNRSLLQCSACWLWRAKDGEGTMANDMEQVQSPFDLPPPNIWMSLLKYITSRQWLSAIFLCGRTYGLMAMWFIFSVRYKCEMLFCAMFNWCVCITFQIKGVSMDPNNLTCYTGWCTSGLLYTIFSNRTKQISELVNS